MISMLSCSFYFVWIEADEEQKSRGVKEVFFKASIEDTFEILFTQAAPQVILSPLPVLQEHWMLFSHLLFFLHH